MSERLPAPRRALFEANPPEEGDYLTLSPHDDLVRIHATGGAHSLAWNELRRWGPTSSRFDHHTWPRREHQRRRIAYLTRTVTAFTAAIAEYFQLPPGGVGPIDASHDAPFATVFRLSQASRLLDLNSGWITRAGGNQAICSGPRGRARDWARMIYAAYPDVVGLTYASSVWGPGRCIALWDRAEHLLPTTPSASRALADPLLFDAVADSAAKLGTYVL